MSQSVSKSPKRGEPFSMFERGEPGAKWLIVGEAPGEDEDYAGRPFIGSSGKLLDALLLQAGLRRSQFHITNVFTRRPPENDLKKHWTLTQSELKKLGYSTTGRLPKLNKRYIHPEHEPEIERLKEEIRQLDPEFILMLGGTALWAITGESRITINRGTLLPLHLAGSTPPTELITSSKQWEANGGSTLPACSPTEQVDQPQSSPLGPSRWGLATFHPAMVLRQWDNRPLVWADLVKVRRFLSRSLPSPLRRKLWVDPSFTDLQHLHQRFLSSGELLGVDIETDPRIDQITTISFGTATEAVCIPFYNKNALPNQCNYWPTAREEAEAWRWVMRFAALPNPKVGQNFLYDHQYLLERMDIRIQHCDDDTAILQHSLQPELPKALGVLASLYINEPAWKFMREATKDDNKADD